MERKFVLEDFIKQNQVGYGSFSKVYRVLEKRSKTTYAAKILKNVLKDRSGQLYSEISREVIILSKLDHPTILKPIFFNPVDFRGKSNPVIITEFASNGSIQKFIEMERLHHPNDNWNDTRKLIITYGISSAMSYLHRHNIIHRDLKPANILIDEFYLPKIADFGLSITAIKDSDDILMQTFSDQIKGTPAYMSPEIWEHDEYSKSSDVYAFGLILYEIYTSERLFENFTIFQILSELKNGYYPPFNKQIPSAYRDLIERCWDHNPEKRPTFDQIVMELKNNKDFITEKVDEKEFFKYVNYIDNYKVTFNRSNPINLYKLFNIAKPKKYLEKILNNNFTLKLFPLKEFIKLKEEVSINFVKEAEKDPIKQFIVGKYLIEGINDFPYNVELGIKYLKQSIKNDIIESLIFYIKMLIEGKVIPKNHKKAIKLLDSHLKNNKSIYFLLYGKLLKNEKRFEEAEKCFEESIKEGNRESMYEYGKILIKDKKYRISEKKGIQNFEMAIEKEYAPAMLKYGQYLIKKNDEQSILLGHDFIRKAADQGNPKANYEYGEILFKKDDITESIQCFKSSAYNGNIKAMQRYASYVYNQGSQKNSPETFEEALNMFKKAADKGNIDSIYSYCKLIPKSDEYVRYLTIAANNGVSDALFEYAVLLCNGDLIPIDVQNELKVFDELKFNEYHKHSNEKSYGLLGNKYTFNATFIANDKGISSNYKKAFLIYMKASNMGNSDAMCNAAHMLHRGIGVHTDINEAIKWYKMAISKNNPKAMHNYALMLYLGDGIPVNYKEAIEYFKMAADRGYARSMFFYAHMLEWGKGVPVNRKEAFKYYSMAAEKGDTSAMNRCACMLLDDNEAPVDYEEVFKYVKMSSYKSDSNAMNGSTCLILDRVPVNYEEAIKYFKMAADIGNPNAMYSLANILYNGIKVPANLEEGIKYYKMAADKGNSNAMFRYACILKKDKSTPDNNEEAIKYFKMAADNGNQNAIFAISFMKSDDKKVLNDNENTVKDALNNENIIDIDIIKKIDYCKNNILESKEEAFKILFSILRIFIDQLKYLFSKMSKVCTKESCPVMSSGSGFQYRWADGNNYKTPTSMPACEYINNLFNWIDEQKLDNQLIEFQSNFIPVMKVIVRRSFRIYAHFLKDHIEYINKTEDCQIWFKSFSDYYYFSKSFDLIPPAELFPLQDIIVTL